VLELAPAQAALCNRVLLGLFLRAVLGWYPLPFEFGGVGLAGPIGIGLLLLVQLVEPFHEQQVGDLLNGGERIGDAAGPEFVPELVDLAFEFGVVLQQFFLLNHERHEKHESKSGLCFCVVRVVRGS